VAIWLFSPIVVAKMNNCRKFILTLLVFTVSFSFQGCFRYTPSRAEMGKESTNLAGSAEFIAYQERLKTRLSALVNERSATVGSATDTAYRLGATDALRIDVFGFSELSGGTEVSADGTISLPLIGTVPAAGRSVAELNSDLTARFSKYVRDPKVRLAIDRYGSRKVSVVGAVPRPGFYPLKSSNYLLTELLAEVGGTKDNSGSRIYLIPGTTPNAPQSDARGQLSLNIQSEPEAKAGVEIDIEELTGTAEKPPLLIPLIAGDTIIIPEAGQFRVDGEVESPGSFPVTRRTSSLSAIAAAGGFTYAANVNEVELVRDIGAGKKASLTVDLEKIAFQGAPDITVRDGDVIIVPSSPGKFRARQVVETFRSIMRGGVSGSIKYQ